MQVVQVRRPRGDGDLVERGEVQRRLHPVLHVVRLHAPRVMSPPPPPTGTYSHPRDYLALNSEKTANQFGSLTV